MSVKTWEELIEISRRQIMVDDEFRMSKLVDGVTCQRVVDVGANVGWWSLKLLEAWPDAEVECYEPIRENFERIPDHPQIRKYQTAVHVSDEPITLHRQTGVDNPSAENNLIWSSDCNMKGPTTETRTVDTVAFRSILSSPIGILKMDVEGHEQQLFSSVTSYDLTSVEVLCLEVHYRDFDDSVISQSGFRKWYHIMGCHPVYRR